MSWTMVPFTDVCNVQGGTQPPKSTFVEEEREGYVRLLQIQDFKRSDKAVFIPDDKNLKKCNSDDILIGRYGASVGKILTGLSGAYNVALVKTIPDSKRLDKKYLYHFLCSPFFQSFILNVGSRAAQAGFNKDDLATLEIPLPQLAEQKRIAAILDKADTIRRKRQQAIQLAEDFLSAIFLEMFGDPVTNPKGWGVKQIKDGIKSIHAGWSANGENRSCCEGELGVLKISAVTTGRFIASENKTISMEDIPEGKKLIFPQRGDLLFSRANTRELVAAACIVHHDSPTTFLPDKLWLIKTEQKLLLPEFFNYLLKLPQFKDKLTSQATGSSGSMLNISMAKFEQTDCLFPPIEIQERFKACYWKVLDNISRLNQSADVLQSNFEALSKNAFTGQL